MFSNFSLKFYYLYLNKIIAQTTLLASSSPCSSSQASTPSGVNDFQHSPDGVLGGTNIRSECFDQKFGSGGGGGGARLALNRIKQRRMVAAAANSDQLPPTSIGCFYFRY